MPSALQFLGNARVKGHVGSVRGRQRDDQSLEPVADSDPYPFYPAGDYIAVCVGSACYRDPRFGVVKVRLDFKIQDLSSFDQPVCKFFNLGKDGKVRQGSDYRRAWIKVNGSAPRRNDRLPRSTGNLFDRKRIAGRA
jgi:hypothetical protein